VYSENALAELQAILVEQQRVRLCIAQVANMLKRMEMRLKKVAPRHRAQH
jgi:uncharacterized coiled-coil protein SlyX